MSNNSKSSVFCGFFVRFVFPSAQALAIIDCVFPELLLSPNIGDIGSCLPSVGMCSSMSLSYCVFRTQSSPLSSNTVFGLFDHVFSRCIAIQAHNISSAVASVHMTHYATTCMFAWHVRKSFCASRSSSFVDFVVSFVDWFVWREYDLSLCVFHRWRQCSSVE